MHLKLWASKVKTLNTTSLQPPATNSYQNRLPQHRPVVKEQSIISIKAQMPRLMVAIADPPQSYMFYCWNPTQKLSHLVSNHKSQRWTMTSSFTITRIEFHNWWQLATTKNVSLNTTHWSKSNRLHRSRHICLGLWWPSPIPPQSYMFNCWILHKNCIIWLAIANHKDGHFKFHDH